MKYVMFIAIFTCNLSGAFYFIMCPNLKCNSHFTEFLQRRDINIRSGVHSILSAYFMTVQFITGLDIAEFPPRSTTLFLVAQLIYYVSNMYFLAELSAIETFSNINKLKYHDFVFSVETLMKEWDFDIEFKRRVSKYLKTQYNFDGAMNMLYQQPFFIQLPFDLFKIGTHITFGRSISQIPIFRGLPDDTIALICTYVFRTMLPPGEVVTYSGEICSEMFVIELGKCEVVSLSKTTAKIIGPGESFSVIEALLNVATVNSVTTLTHCQVLALRYVDLITALRNYPEVIILMIFDS